MTKSRPTGDSDSVTQGTKSGSCLGSSLPHCVNRFDKGWLELQAILCLDRDCSLISQLGSYFVQVMVEVKVNVSPMSVRMGGIHCLYCHHMFPSNDPLGC